MPCALACLTQEEEAQETKKTKLQGFQPFLMVVYWQGQIEFDLITAENYNRCSAPKPKRECCGSLSAAYDARTLHLIIVSGQMFKINTARVFDDIYLSTKALGNRNLI
ncbi:MAG: hypothetical protein KDC85_10615 [Saprospiraceae bacterium]|nr:hypothetical protein [Saprospiraceae bacterium]